MRLILEPESSGFAYHNRVRGINLSHLKMFIIRLVEAVAGRRFEEDDRCLSQIFAAMIRDYNPMISKMAYSYTNTKADYDDLRQDIMVNLWKGLKTFRFESQTGTWVYRVALNTCVSTIRSRKWLASRNDGENVLLSMTDSDDDKNHIESVELLHSMIQGLSQDDKAIINLWLDDMSYEEISAIMGLKRNTVATRIRRIKEKLANEFNDKI